MCGHSWEEKITRPRAEKAGGGGGVKTCKEDVTLRVMANPKKFC